MSENQGSDKTIEKKDESNANEQKKSTTATTATQTEENKCSICMSEITDRAYLEPCHHNFCFGCIREWVQQQSHCPVCRQSSSNIAHNFRSETDFDRLPVVQRPLRLEEVIASIQVLGGCTLNVQVYVPGYFINTGNESVSITRRGQTMALNTNTVYHFLNVYGDETLTCGHAFECIHQFLAAFERLRFRHLFIYLLSHEGANNSTNITIQ